MRKALLITLVFFLLTLSIMQAAIAQQANIITNQTTEPLYVIYSTKFGAHGAIPAGYWTAGWKRISVGQQETFWAYDPHKIYFQIWKGHQRVKPRRSTQTFAFWINPNADFNVVTRQEINASITRGQLVYSSHDTGVLRRRDGFMRYNNGSRITVTDAWVDVDDNADADLDMMDDVTDRKVFGWNAVEVLRSHTGAINALAWHPTNSQRLASGSSDKTVRVWHFAEMTTSVPLRGHTGAVLDIAWQPDGTKFDSAGSDGTIRIWDPTIGSLIKIRVEEVHPIVAISLKGSFQYYTTEPEETSLDLSWDTKHAVVGLTDNTIQVWSIEPFNHLRDLTGHTGSVNAVAWSPDDARVVSGSADATVRIWDPQTGRLLRTLRGHAGGVNAIAWSPDGTRVVSGSDDGTVRIWDAEVGALLETLREHTGGVNAVAWSPDGTRIASGGADNIIRLWEKPEDSDMMSDGVEEVFEEEVFDDGMSDGVAEDISQPVHIPDPNLRAAIEDELGKIQGATITQADMLKLTDLGHSAHSGIEDLTGLELAVNLTQLYLSDSQVTDISPLAELKNLKELYLDYNYISNISPLAELKNLKELYLANNEISDISPLAELKNLSMLTLDNRISLGPVSIPKEGGNRITDISPLAELKNLTFLSLSRNEISDISPLAELKNLTFLSLSRNEISDISPLAELKNLKELYLTNNRISDFSPIAGLIPNLQNYGNENQRPQQGQIPGYDPTEHPPDAAIMDGGMAVNIPDPNLRAAIEKTLGKTPATTITVPGVVTVIQRVTITVAEMLTLTQLGPTNVGIQDLTGLEFAKNLTWLSLGGNSISDVSALAGLTNLTTLDLKGNSISDVSALAGLTNLTFLGLLGNSISDVSALAGLTNLTTLDLEGNSISDVSALAGLTNLTTLDLGGNSISDVSALAGLTNLTTLDLARNKISDFSPIAGLVSNLHRYDNRSQFANEPVHVPDAALRRAIEGRLDKARNAKITRADMLKLTQLGAGRTGIQDLTGLEFARNLRILSLPANHISDVSVLSGLTNLTILELNNNQISDISPLRGLTNLSELRLSYNFISDFSPIAGLVPNLKKYLNRNQGGLLPGGVRVRKTENSYGATVYERSDGNETVLIKGLELQGVNDSKVYADYTQFLPPQHGKHFRIYTQKGSTCGQYSALMLLNYYGVNVSKETFDDVADITHTLWGTTPHELRKGLGALLPVGFEHYKIAYPAYASLRDKVSESRPPIIVIRLSEIGYHHVVVVGYDSKTHKFLIADPNGFFFWNHWEEWSNTGRISKKSGKEIWRPPLRDSWRLDYQKEDVNNAWDVWLVPDMQWISRVPWVGDTFSPYRMFVPKEAPPYHHLASKTVEIYVTGDVEWNPFKWTWHDWEEERTFNGKVMYATQYSEDRNGDVRDIRIEGNKVIVSGRISNGVPLDANILGVDEVFYGAIDMVLTAYYDPSVAAAPAIVLPAPPMATTLLPNYPNPFNPETWIPYHLAEPADVTLTIYAIDGKVVRHLDLGHQAAGYYQSKARAAYWDGRNTVGERVASGIYFYTLKAGDFSATRKLLIRK